MNVKINYNKLLNKSKTPINEYNRMVYSIMSGEKSFIYPGEKKIIKTFLEIEIPEGFFGLILSRKENYLKHGLEVFQDLIFPCGQKKELLLILYNSNIPKSPIMMTDNERFLGGRSKIDIYSGDKIANFLLIKGNEFIFES